ncbi:HTH-type transcriptional regulator RutR [Microvirga zambiensis]|uniref:HTH-type transcriptional regulator RutR n=1 Tax=Microvirga zambiensis TaxID=1402137 RepID=UPI001FE282F8|nr:HTH-type transcriptional regulator RutR [Microvirga zambiensis]
MSVRASPRKTRAGEANTQRILDAALEVFAAYGFQGARIDQIAVAAGLSKPNLLYYFRTKEDLYTAVLRRTLDMWLEPLRELDASSDPRVALGAYIARKLDYSRSHPTASRLFAMEMLQGAPHLGSALTGHLRDMVEAKSSIIETWIREGRLRPIDPKHLIFAIWATTQHYADFGTQIRSLTGKSIENIDFYEATRTTLTSILLDGVLPSKEKCRDV